MKTLSIFAEVPAPVSQRYAKQEKWAALYFLKIWTVA